MSTEHHKTGHGKPHGASPRPGGEPRHETVAFEQRDVQVRTIYWYLFSLAVATILAFASASVILNVTTKMVAESDAPVMPMRKMMTQEQKANDMYPPEPRLQGIPGHEMDAQFDLREKIQADTQANEQLRWIDQNSGIAQIPVSEAMKLIVEKGVHGAPPAAKPPETSKIAPAGAPPTPSATEKKN
jgi:hypothetical protein